MPKRRRQRYPPPLSARESDEALKAHLRQAEGLPSHLAEWIKRWLGEVFFYDFEFGDWFLRDFELRCHRSAPTASASFSASYLLDTVTAWMASDEDYGLDLLDHALFAIDDPGNPADRSEVKALRTQLEEILKNGGSAWMVNPTGKGLTRRVSDESTAAAALVVSAKDGASEHIARAWKALYGRGPNTSTAYRESVKAVESLLCPAILPKDRKATLGKAIAALRDAPSRLKVAFTDSAKVNNITTLSPQETVIGMLDALWKNQHDRHGGDTSVPLDATEEEAQAAVHLALTLVTWLQRGLLKIQ